MTTEEQAIVNNASANNCKIDLSNFKLWYLRFEGEDKTGPIRSIFRDRLFGALGDVDYVKLFGSCYELISINAGNKKQKLYSDLVIGAMFDSALSSINFEQAFGIARIDSDPLEEGKLGELER